MNIQLDRILLFMNPKVLSKGISEIVDPKTIQRKLNICNDNKEKHSICDPEVQYFGWKVTAIILIIVTIGSLILVISLSVTMPYNVYNKPKIQLMPTRLTDGVITSY